MKLQFDANLQYQAQAVAAVVDLFRGQMPKQSNFTVTNLSDQGTMFTDNGVGNRLELVEDEILENLQAVQLRNGLPQTKTLKKGAYDFDIEMETGTGKTYVYLRTIFELNKAYGLKKFIIVVPSIAIKEGVAKSLEITREHFQTVYESVVYDTYIYDGSRPEDVRSFAVNDNISIMVLNIAAFRKSFDDPEKENKANIIHRAIDQPDPGDQPHRHRGRAPERGGQGGHGLQKGHGVPQCPVYPALFRHPRGKAQPGVQAGRGGRLRPGTGEANRGGQL